MSDKPLKLNALTLRYTDENNSKCVFTKEFAAPMAVKPDAMEAFIKEAVSKMFVDSTYVERKAAEAAKQAQQKAEYEASKKKEGNV